MSGGMPGDGGPVSEFGTDRPEESRTASRAHPPLLSDEQWVSLAIHHELRKREVEVLKWLTRGVPLPNVAELLALRYETVRGYARSGYRKLGCRGRVDLILRLVHAHWVPVKPVSKTGRQVRSAGR